ncbi:MAG: signal recognition particle protein [Candidatus Marinimicrobia bacterium]|nr:signal recognition particle protein [Candidatus Neomarinimicrobiota bacterium]
MLEQLSDRFDSIFRNLRGLGKITDSNIRQTSREIRRVLLEADVNFTVAKDFVQRVSDRAEGTKVIKSVKPGEQFIKIIRDELIGVLGKTVAPLELKPNKTTVILMAGLQGSGKTTTCAKLAHLIKKQGKSVLLVAADVYRPAAIEQLKVMGKSVGCEVYDEGQSDPVKICSRAIDYAKSEKLDVVILDTAGRLHIDGEMMVEIQNISEAAHPDEIFFVVDGMTGQDAVNSALAFKNALNLTGTILTKLDGDARGGAAVSITEVTGTPIKFIGVSEKIDGLENFDPKRLADRILGFGDVVSLVEKAQEAIDVNEAERISERLKKQQFDLEDFRSQLKQISKMGSMNQLLGMMPGMNRKALKNINVDDGQMKWMEAIINSMTPRERQKPSILNGSRRKRIASGSGRSLQEVNQLLKQFHQLQKMMKQFGKMRMPGIGKFKGAFEQFM